LLNVGCIAAIARGLANGLTLDAVAGAVATVADIAVAGADSADRTGAGEREPVGAGATARARGTARIGAGAIRVSTEVTSLTSREPGMRGIGVSIGRDFRYVIQPPTLCKTTTSMRVA
jgi:hypothetical protein